MNQLRRSLRVSNLMPVAGFVGAWLAGMVMTVPAPGSATDVLMSASACMPATETTDYVAGGGEVSAVSAYADLYCPFIAGFSHYNVTYLSVAGRDATTSGYATISACVQDWSSSTWTCPSPSYSSTTAPPGYFIVYPSRAAWNNSLYTSWFGYIHYELPPNFGALGYYAST